MSQEQTVTCPKCKKSGFLKLSAHRCDVLDVSATLPSAFTGIDSLDLAVTGGASAPVIASGAATDILPADQAARIDRIKAYHTGLLRAFGDQMGFAFLAGCELLTAKVSLPHGQFMKWRQAHLPELSNGTVGNYMNFASALAPQISNAVGNLPAVGNSAPLLLTNGSLSDEQNQQIRDAVKKVANGRTFTQMYQDLDIVKQPEPKKFTPPAKLTAEEALAAEKAQDREFVRMMLGPLRQCRTVSLKISDQERDEIISECVETANHFRALKKTRAPKSNRRKPGEGKAARAAALAAFRDPTK